MVHILNGVWRGAPFHVWQCHWQQPEYPQTKIHQYIEKKKNKSNQIKYPQANMNVPANGDHTTVNTINWQFSFSRDANVTQLIITAGGFYSPASVKVMKWKAEKQVLCFSLLSSHKHTNSSRIHLKASVTFYCSLIGPRPCGFFSVTAWRFVNNKGAATKW